MSREDEARAARVDITLTEPDARRLLDGIVTEAARWALSRGLEWWETSVRSAAEEDARAATAARGRTRG